MLYFVSLLCVKKSKAIVMVYKDQQTKGGYYCKPWCNDRSLKEVFLMLLTLCR